MACAKIRDPLAYNTFPSCSQSLLFIVVSIRILSPSESLSRRGEGTVHPRPGCKNPFSFRTFLLNKASVILLP